jgi:serine/threonine protein kinase
MGAPVRVGDVLADKYEVTRILGVGGMGVVVAARHAVLDKLVALKFMHEEIAANEAAIDRFLREARAAARLQNEHVARVLDVGQLDNGVPYIVMEYLEGRDLGQLLEERGRLGIAEAVEYLLQTCEAMAEAHAAGIVHRDLKPQNLFVTVRQDGRPLIKVLDFGISKAEHVIGHTATQQAIGTPAYMAPEQMRSARSVDARADVWSLGVILYQLVSNMLPFAGETVPEIMLSVMSDAPRPLDGVPRALVRVIQRCLEKDRESRYANVAELAQDLTPFAPERARAAIALIERVVSAGIAQPTRPPVDDVASATIPPESRLGPQQTTLGGAAASTSTPVAASSRRWLAVVVAVALAFGGVVVGLAFKGSSSSSGSTIPAAAVADGPSIAPIADAVQPVAIVPDAAVDAAVDAAPPRDAARKPPADAAHRKTVDAPALEPATTEERVLVPAKENP